MRRVTLEERAVGAILDLVVGALRTREGDDLTLKHAKECCRQACRIMAVFRKPRPKTAME